MQGDESKRLSVKFISSVIFFSMLETNSRFSLFPLISILCECAALSSSFVFPVQEDAREISNQLQSREKNNAQFYDMSDKLETGLLFFCRRALLS